MNLDQVLSKLENVRKCGSGYSARCPFHNDKNNSLSVNEGADGILLIRCHAGCTFEAIMTALGSVNGQPRTNQSKSKDTSPKFNYTDAEVKNLAEALIDEWKTGGLVADWLRLRGISRDVSLLLRFGATQRTFPKVGHSAALAIPLYHDKKLVGVKYRAVPDKDHLAETGSSMSGLYGRPDDPAKEILLLEGPPDVALAMSYKFNCVGIQSAETKPTKADLALLGEYLTIFIIGDSDRKGREAMNRWQTELNADYPQALIRVNLGGYKDIGGLYAADPPNFRTALETILRLGRAGRDYFDPDDLLTETELRGAKVRELSVVSRLVPRKQITMFFGEEKSGKTLLATYIAKCVANGISVFEKYPTTQMPVLYLDLENGHDELEANTQWFSRLGPAEIRFRTRETGVPALDSPGLIRYCEKYQPLVIIDSQTKAVKKYFDAARRGKGSQFDPDDMSGFYDQLLDLCAAGATIIIIHHATKADAEQYANSHQIGANVSRAFAIVSEDRPLLNRVRLQGILFRGAEPVSEQLIGFPLIPQTGHFGLTDVSETPIDRLVRFVKELEAKGQTCTAEQIKSRKGIGRNRSVVELNQAIGEGRLFWPKKRGPISSVREAPYGATENIPYVEPRTESTEADQDDVNVH